MENLDISKTSKDQKEFLCFAVNQYGDGQHPWISTNNVKFVQAPYARECVRKAMKSKTLSPEGKKLAETLLLEVL